MLAEKKVNQTYKLLSVFMNMTESISKPKYISSHYQSSFFLS